MRREGTLEELSDGKLYQAGDMVKAGCQDCEGCSACCSGMGNSLVLDPYDIFQMTKGLGVSFQQLMEKSVELHMVDGVILPNMAMSGEKETCAYLDTEGRCSIHGFRPGICRLFPLGRYYEGDRFYYILQTNECKKASRTKVKVKKFLGIPNLGKYESYILDWHGFLKKMEQAVLQGMREGADEKVKQLSMGVLQDFYVVPYNLEGDDETFFAQYYERRRKYRWLDGHEDA